MFICKVYCVYLLGTQLITVIPYLSAHNNVHLYRTSMNLNLVSQPYLPVRVHSNIESDHDQESNDGIYQQGWRLPSTFICSVTGAQDAFSASSDESVLGPNLKRVSTLMYNSILNTSQVHHKSDLKISNRVSYAPALHYTCEFADHFFCRISLAADIPAVYNCRLVQKGSSGGPLGGTTMNLQCTTGTSVSMDKV
jgi:hypothetical protein